VIERPRHCGSARRAQRLVCGAPALLLSDVLPVRSTPRMMQGTGPVRNDRDPSDRLAPALQRGRAAQGRSWAAPWRACARSPALPCSGGAGWLQRGASFRKGYILPPGALEQIPIGASQDQVLIVMGTPRRSPPLNGEVFYYISTALELSRVHEPAVGRPARDRDRSRQETARCSGWQYGLQDGKISIHQPHHRPAQISYLTPLSS